MTQECPESYQLPRFSRRVPSATAAARPTWEAIPSFTRLRLSIAGRLFLCLSSSPSLPISRRHQVSRPERNLLLPRAAAGTRLGKLRTFAKPAVPVRIRSKLAGDVPLVRHRHLYSRPCIRSELKGSRGSLRYCFLHSSLCFLVRPSFFFPLLFFYCLESVQS